MTKKCPHFGQETPHDFDCSDCTVQEKCYQAWQKAYDEIIDNCLSGLISYEKANEKLAEMGCEVPSDV